MANSLFLLAMVATSLFAAAAQNCDRNRLCPDNNCCSQWGWCGCTAEHCGSGCQSQCNWCSGGSTPPPGPSNGEATFYSPYVPSSCYGFDTGPFLPGPMIAAASPDIFNNKALCGAIFDITCRGAVSGSGGCTSTPTVRVKVVDLCPGCHSNSFDLSVEAFTRIANPDVGRIRISSARRLTNAAGEEEQEETEMEIGISSEELAQVV